MPRAELEAAFSDKTKLILVNTPMNPCAKVFNRDELEFIAALCRKHDAFAVCDEVYEHLTFDGRAAYPYDHYARYARPHRADSVGRQNLLADGMEDRE